MSNPMITNALIMGDLYELLTGQNGYALVNPYRDTPTDPSQVVESILKAFPNNEHTMQETLDGIIAVTRDPIYSWFAIYYVNLVLRYRENFGKKADLQAFVNTAIANIRKQETSLRALKQWEGATEAEGCWGVVTHMIGQMKKYEQRDGIVIPSLD
ncbi:MAG: hypothetical protein KA239_11115 [Bacteroidia bacterium]|nr:hypothetical protein [Bacteroidia bacterium]